MASSFQSWAFSDSALRSAPRGLTRRAQTPLACRFPLVTCGSRRRRGLTLTEILIATGILGVGLVLVLAAFPVALIQHQESVEHTEGVVAAKNTHVLLAERRADLGDVTWDGASTHWNGDLVFGNPTALVPPGIPSAGNPADFALGSTVPRWFAMPVVSGDASLVQLTFDQMRSYLDWVNAVNLGPLFSARPANTYSTLPILREDTANAYFGRQDRARTICWPFFRDTDTSEKVSLSFRTGILRVTDNESYPILSWPGAPGPPARSAYGNDPGAPPDGFPPGSLCILTSVPNPFSSFPVPWRINLAVVAGFQARLNHYAGTAAGAPLVYDDGADTTAIVGSLLHPKMVLFGVATGQEYRVVEDLGRQQVDPFQQVVDIRPALDPNDAAVDAGVWFFPPSVRVSGTTIVLTNKSPYVAGQ